ncbi:hypothetical protein, partial [Candidatus Infernicultor aquiphilus]|uniref:hypothetical protein n=1 Tax=Candidatus Infernicultor aquiphilus TaxID=1805029 RepID=UPI0038735382
KFFNVEYLSFNGYFPKSQKYFQKILYSNTGSDKSDPYIPLHYHSPIRSRTGLFTFWITTI